MNPEKTHHTSPLRASYGALFIREKIPRDIESVYCCWYAERRSLSSKKKMPVWRKVTLQWRHNGRDGVSNHRRLDCLLSCLFRCTSKKIPKLRVTYPLVTGGFPSHKGPRQNISPFCRRHHDVFSSQKKKCIFKLVWGVKLPTSLYWFR